MTLNDFIQYNNPCFSCNSKISLTLHMVNEKTNIHTPLKPVPFKKYIKFALQVGYRDSLDLIIDPINNKFDSNNHSHLKTYLLNREINFEIECQKCETAIITNKVEFMFKDGFIKPLTIKFEDLIVKNKNNIYKVYNFYNENRAAAEIINKKGNSPNVIIDIKLFPLFKFKTKENFIKKLKTYLIFS